MSKNIKKKKNRVLSDEMFLREASDFWDEHSFSDYDDVQEVHFDVNLKEEIHYFAVEKKISDTDSSGCPPTRCVDSDLGKFMVEL